MVKWLEVYKVFMSLSDKFLPVLGMATF